MTLSIKNVFVINESTGLSYEDAIELDDVTPDDAKKEISRHSADWNEFISDVGRKTRYTGKEILSWLGY